MSTLSNEIVAGINESSAIIEDITRYSTEQSSSIEEISKGIQQVSHVVEQNSATAQESAAAAEEMSSQSFILADTVARFKLREAALLGRGRNTFNLPEREA